MSFFHWYKSKNGQIRLYRSIYQKDHNEIQMPIGREEKKMTTMHVAAETQIVSFFPSLSTP